ncbi:MAG: hypothetical protein M3232_01450, partial [Thermoproteota archaeon]|nr:hypothetical protein [Thermoproteota archaeon]
MEGEDVRIPIKEHYRGERGGGHSYDLDGILTIPQQQEMNSKRHIVVFAHGSGSSGRYSPGNQYVASVLNN